MTNIECCIYFVRYLIVFVYFLYISFFSIKGEPLVLLPILLNGSIFMGREELKLKILNGSARLIARQDKVEEKDINLLIEGVMDHMMETATELLHFDNLYVQINFEEAAILSFLIDDGEGRVLDLDRYTGVFDNKLSEKRKEGLSRLMSDLSIDKREINYMRRMVFSKN